MVDGASVRNRRFRRPVTALSPRAAAVLLAILAGCVSHPAPAAPGPGSQTFVGGFDFQATVRGYERTRNTRRVITEAVNGTIRFEADRVWVNSSRGACDVPDAGGPNRRYRVQCGELFLDVRRRGGQLSGRVSVPVTETYEIQRCQTVNGQQTCTWDSFIQRNLRSAALQILRQS